MKQDYHLQQTYDLVNVLSQLSSDKVYSSNVTTVSGKSSYVRILSTFSEQKDNDTRPRNDDQNYENLVDGVKESSNILEMAQSSSPILRETTF